MRERKATPQAEQKLTQRLSSLRFLHLCKSSHSKQKQKYLEAEPFVTFSQPPHSVLGLCYEALKSSSMISRPMAPHICVDAYVLLVHVSIKVSTLLMKADFFHKKLILTDSIYHLIVVVKDTK